MTFLDMSITTANHVKVSSWAGERFSIQFKKLDGKLVINKIKA
jgi:hypothetical protein